MTTALRVAAVLIWFGVLYAMTTWGNTEAALACGALATFLLGALVGRWWVVLAALVPGGILAAMSVAGGADDTGHGSGVEWAVFAIAPATLVVAAVIGLGVLFHHGLRAIGGHRSSPHPQA